MPLKHLITCVVAGIDYLVHPQILGSVQESVRADQVIPVLVLSEKELEAGPEKLWDTLQYYVQNDDVCVDDFTGILVVTPTPGSDSHGDVDQWAASDLSNFSSVYHMTPDTRMLEQKHELPSGPYFLSGPNLHQAWRLYPDNLDAFTFGLLPDDVYSPQSFQAVTSQSSDGVSKTIPVPSRHYHQAVFGRPFAGARMVVTDSLDIEGVRTTLSSRAWAELYPKANATGSYVNRLIGQGAIIVGKSKTTQFSAGTEWLDFQSPVNPRGDGYQESTGSSAGAAAALAGYAWLDHAVGGDSDGGVRDSAAQHGLHGLRSTFGSAPLDGVGINSPRYDTIGLLGRSPRDISFVASRSITVPPPSADRWLPGKLVYPTDFFPLPDPEHQKLLESFVEDLEAYLDFERVEVDLARLWSETTHSRAAAKNPLHEYMKKAPFWSLCRDFHHTTKSFRTEYQDKFDRAPFIEATPSFRLNIGANVSDDEQELYLDRIATFRTWFDREVMASGNHSNPDAIVVLPYGDAEPRCRDARSDNPTAIEGIDATLLSPVLGTPHLVVPFAQLPYESRISDRTEYKPISISIMGARGNDLALLRLIQEVLESAGRRTKVSTGRYTFPVGSNTPDAHNGSNNDGQEASTLTSSLGGEAGPVEEL